MGYTAKLVCSAELVKDGESQALKVEDQVTVKYATPNAGEVEVTGKVIGIQLGGVRPSANQYGPLFDGIATSTYNADKLAGDIEGTMEFELTISVNPGDDSTIFMPYIRTNRKYVVRPGLRYYYDLDENMMHRKPADPDGSVQDAAVL